MRFRRLVTLDGLRGLAAIVVVNIHVDVFSSAPGVAAPNRQLPVDFFFILSGYVLAYSYDAKLPAMGWRAFLRIRLIRLYPLYAAGLFAGLTFFAGHLWFGRLSEPHPQQMIAAAILGTLMLPSPFGRDSNPLLYPLDPPAWSLLFELLANVTYAAMARYLSTRRLVMVTILGFGALAITGAVYQTTACGYQWFCVEGGAARVWFYFSAGILLFRLFPPKTARASNGEAFLVAVGMTAFFIMCPEQSVIATLLEILFFPLILIWGSRIEPTGPLLKFFSISGVFSYAIYVLHYPLLQWMDVVIKRSHDFFPEPRTALILLVTAALVPLSAAAQLYIDGPARRWLTEITSGWEWR